MLCYMLEVSRGRRDTSDALISSQNVDEATVASQRPREYGPHAVVYRNPSHSTPDIGFIVGISAEDHACSRLFFSL